MLAKKFLISFLTLGAIGISGAGIYYSINKENDTKATENGDPSDTPVPKIVAKQNSENTDEVVDAEEDNCLSILENL